MKKEVMVFIEKLPLTPSEKIELTQAFERSLSFKWVKAREEIKGMVSERIEEKESRTLRALLTEEKISKLVPIEENLMYYIEELWELGYSSAAISKGLNFAVSAARISQKLEPVSVRKRGQVVELLDDFQRDFDLEKWRLKGSYSYRQGPKITEQEKEKFRSMRSQGYSISYIAEVSGRSENAVRRYVK